MRRKMSLNNCASKKVGTDNMFEWTAVDLKIVDSTPNIITY